MSEPDTNTARSRASRYLGVNGQRRPVGPRLSKWLPRLMYACAAIGVIALFEVVVGHQYWMLLTFFGTAITALNLHRTRGRPEVHRRRAQ